MDNLLRPSRLSSLPARVVLMGAALFIMLWGIRAMAPVINPLLLSVMIAIILLPLYRRLCATRLHDGLALLVTALAPLGIGAGLLGFVIFSLRRLVDALPTYQAALEARIIGLQNTLAGLNISLAEQFSADWIDLSSVASAVLGLLGNLTGLVANAIFILILVLAFLVEMPRIRRKLGVAFGEDGSLLTRLHAISRSVQSYLVLRTEVNAMTGGAIGLLLLLVGTDFAILWGIVAAILSYIPYVGLVIAAIPPVLVTWLEFGLTRTLIVIAGITAINMAVENLLSPSLMSRGMRLAPVVVLGALLFWGFELGTLGIMLSVPLTVMLVYALDSFDETRWLALMMSGADPDEPEESALAADCTTVNQ